MRVLYVAHLSPNDSAEYRRLALERGGHTCIPVNQYGYGMKQVLLRKVEHRLVAGPEVRRFNRDLIALARQHRPDVLWCDKALFLQPATLDAFRAMGIPTISYMIDNFFGPRRDPGWRLYAKTIPLFDLHCTQRDANVPEYMAAGARDVIKIQTAFEPTIHFPAEKPYTDAQRDRGVSFIGTAYDQRAETLTRLAREGLPVAISGGPQHWKPKLSAEEFAALYREGELYRDQYRSAIWRSRINLSFLTHSNADEFVHKSFEIAACGGFLLAERSPGHTARFVEDEEAVFFHGYDELLAKVRRYLPDEAARNRIALAGQRRAWTSGYDNDTQVRLILERVAPLTRGRGAASHARDGEVYA
ncbi:CgeB family protein [Terriglobus aquaticus]|uniref:Glycosyltransferase n=1 Tax=Terriglobus aquaticus TaxID=940139 RepID=A0ABW9KKR4_9BACT|nr:glycosyltransferase [Terriglobus aquaticus]